MDNRNIYGFALFTLIVITTVFTSYAFFAPPLRVHVAPPQPIVIKENTYSCRSKSKSVPQKIEQAVLNLDTKILDVNLNFGSQLPYSPENGVTVTFHFYTKSPQPKKIGTETVWFKPNSLNAYERTYAKYPSDASTVGMIRTACSYHWASKLRKNQSVYVIAKVAPTMNDVKNAAVEFNETEAFSVLLYSDK